jgi:U6 snRNA-associated Sm-like protein LSm7
MAGSKLVSLSTTPLEQIHGQSASHSSHYMASISHLFAFQGRGASRGARGGPAKRGGGAGTSSTQEKPKREAILDLSRYVGTKVKVTFIGGRQGTSWKPLLVNAPLIASAVTGILKGFDQLLNLVLDQVDEEPSGSWFLSPRYPSHSFAEFQQRPRQLGLAVVRGPTVTLISPAEGFEEIADPFAES